MTFKILSLDGGGTWALIEVRALIELYGGQTRGNDLLRCFDLVAANSGGSIVLGALVENMTLDEILLLFKDEANRRAIFAGTTKLFDVMLHWLPIFPQYSTDAKLRALERLMPRTGGKALRDVVAGLMGPAEGQMHLLIIGFDYDRNRATFFRSAAIGASAWGNGEAAAVSLAGAVHASTTAPIRYFDAPATLSGSADRYWDGALTGNNNPALAACVEAVTLNHQPHDLRILSLGSATKRRPLAAEGVPPSEFFAPRPESSPANDIGKVATAILDDPPDFATFAAYALTGGDAGLPAGVASRIVRLNPLVSPLKVGAGWTAPGDWAGERFQRLCNIAMDAIEPDQIDAIDEWCSLWIRGVARNQPIRMNGQTLEREIGSDHFSEAAAAWKALAPSGVVYREPPGA